MAEEGGHAVRSGGQTIQKKEDTPYGEGIHTKRGRKTCLMGMVQVDTPYGDCGHVIQRKYRQAIQEGNMPYREGIQARQGR